MLESRSERALAQYPFAQTLGLLAGDADHRRRLTVMARTIVNHQPHVIAQAGKRLLRVRGIRFA